MKSTVLFFLLFIPLLGIAQAPQGDSISNMSYLQNKLVMVGVDLSLGGAITYISEANKSGNLINNRDWGRQVQMSFYSGPVPYESGTKRPAPAWSFIGWNPIQSRDVAGNRSKILAHVNNGRTIYIKCIPMHWPLDNVPGECYYESWITLNANAIKIHSRMVNLRPDKKQYAARDQELPAVYTNAPFHRLFTYIGDKPFKHDKLTAIKNHNYPGKNDIHWAKWQTSENWAANVDENNFGLGVWNEGIVDFTGGFYGDSTFIGGSKSLSAGYIAPVRKEILDYNITYDYIYTLILGNLTQIREYVYNHRKKQRLPAFHFNDTRSHWYYENTDDAGWPIRSGLAIKLNPRAMLVSPTMYWKGKDAAELNIKAAFHGQTKLAKIYWRPENEDFNEKCSLTFRVIPDGKFHTYQVVLSNSAFYRGTLTGLKIQLDSGESPSVQGTVQVRSIRLKQ